MFFSSVLLPTAVLAFPGETEADFYHQLAAALTRSPPYARGIAKVGFSTKMACKFAKNDITITEIRSRRLKSTVDGRDVEGNDFFNKLAAALVKDGSVHRRDNSENKVTKTEIVDQNTGVGELAFGASNLPLGYSARAGINFDAVNGT